jgi:cytochrome P450
VTIETPINLLAPEVLRNPHPVLAALREDSAIHKLTIREAGAYPWLVTRYADCMALLKDERFTKDASKLERKRPPTETETAAMSINHHMLTVDPPDHTRLRGLVHKAFTPRMIAALQTRIQEVADQLIDRMAGKREIDLIADYAFVLPVTVIADLLGIPASDQDNFRRWSQTIVIGGLRGDRGDELAVAAMEFIMYFHEMFERRRAEPQDDLITALVQVEEAGDVLEPQELISMVFLLLVAGHETTVNLIGNGTLALLQHPDQLDLLRRKPELIDTAIEEMLRYDGPVGASTMRWALDDLEMDGKHIPKGAMVLASLLAANRDPAAFENPDMFDITRNPNKHIAFGHGIHYCLGAPLARLEGAIAMNTLLRRLPNLRLAARPDELEWNETLLLHGMKAMPVGL